MFLPKQYSTPPLPENGMENVCGNPITLPSYITQQDCAYVIFVCAVCAQNFHETLSVHGWLSVPKRGFHGGCSSTEVRKKGCDLKGTIFGIETP